MNPPSIDLPSIKPRPQVIAAVNFTALVVSRALEASIPEKQFFSERFTAMYNNFLPLEENEVQAELRGKVLLKQSIHDIESTFKALNKEIGTADFCHFGCESFFGDWVPLMRRTLACVLAMNRVNAGEAFLREDGSRYLQDGTEYSVVSLGNKFSADALTILRFYR